jgi:hypothetical protein
MTTVRSISTSASADCLSWLRSIEERMEKSAFLGCVWFCYTIMPYKTHTYIYKLCGSCFFELSWWHRDRVLESIAGKSLVNGPEYIRQKIPGQPQSHKPSVQGLVFTTRFHKIRDGFFLGFLDSTKPHPFHLGPGTQNSVLKDSLKPTMISQRFLKSFLRALGEGLST